MSAESFQPKNIYGLNDCNAPRGGICDVCPVRILEGGYHCSTSVETVFNLEAHPEDVANAHRMIQVRLRTAKDRGIITEEQHNNLIQLYTDPDSFLDDQAGFHSGI